MTPEAAITLLAIILAAAIIQRQLTKIAKRLTAIHSVMVMTAAKQALHEAIGGRGMLTCGECGKPVLPKDEVLLGDIAFHKTCCDAWCDRWSAEIAKRHQPNGGHA